MCERQMTSPQTVRVRAVRVANDEWRRWRRRRRRRAAAAAAAAFKDCPRRHRRRGSFMARLRETGCAPPRPGSVRAASGRAQRARAGAR